MIPSSLEKQLTAALESREARHIRRSLPPSTDTALVDFSSNDYLSLSKSPELRTRFLEKLGSTEQILGSGGSRLLINGSAHVDLEDRLRAFFGRPDAAPQPGRSSPPAPTLDALLFNSGFDANVGFFACIPQPGDFIVYDEYIHASVHDGMRMSRARSIPFKHNSVEDLEKILFGLKNERPGLVDGNGSVFIAVESLYSMDGTISPLTDIIRLAESAFPSRNAYVSIDEAHSTGIYGPNGRGLVNLFGLQSRVFARLHTFGKALAGTGAVLLVPPLVKQYLINYARTLIYTTSLSYANIISANCSFDILESGDADERSRHVLALCEYLTATLVDRLRHSLTPITSEILSLPEHLRPSASTSSPPQLPTPIVPLMTSYPRPLAARLRTVGLNARPITWPTVPKGKERVRICLHAGNTLKEVDLLIQHSIRWATEMAVGSSGGVLAKL